MDYITLNRILYKITRRCRRCRSYPMFIGQIIKVSNHIYYEFRCPCLPFRAMDKFSTNIDILDIISKWNAINHT